MLFEIWIFYGDKVRILNILDLSKFVIFKQSLHFLDIFEFFFLF